MDNVIVIFVDSVFSDCIGKGRTKVSSTPFVDSLMNNSIFMPNVFSFGPYTNAATKGLFCSAPTLDDYGYYFGINTVKDSHYKIFKDNGYETYSFYYPYYIISNETIKSIDHTVYSGGFVYSAIWRGQFEYYKKIKEHRELTKDEIKLLDKFVCLLFDCWETYYKKIIEEPESRILIDYLIDLNKIEKSLKKLEEEQRKFDLDHNKYIAGILEEEMSHPLADVDCIEREKYADNDFLRKVYSSNRDRFRKIQKVNKWSNILNNRVSGRYVLSSIKSFFETGNKDHLRYFYNIYCCLNAPNKMIKDSLNGVWQEMPSARTQIRKGIEILKKRELTNKPFYMLFHVLDAHERISYFSYDSNDLTLVSEEIKDAEEFASKNKKHFKGNIVYQLSLHYIDACISELFHYLSESGLDKNTTVMIVADHGSSYTYFPIRKNVVNNYHRENYNIPALIWNRNLPKNILNGYYMSSDLYKTLYATCGMKSDYRHIKGIDAMEYPNGRDYVISEYMGPGCPDMLTKEVWLSIRNKEYLLAFKCHLNEQMSISKLVEAYDLKNDPLEMRNIASFINLKDTTVSAMYNIIKERFDEICANRDSFINTIDEIII